MDNLQVINELFNSSESCPFAIKKCKLLYNPDEVRKVLRLTLCEQTSKYSDIKISICCYNADGFKLSVMDNVPYVNGGVLVELSSLLTEYVAVMVKSARSEDGILWKDDTAFPDTVPLKERGLEKTAEKETESFKSGDTAQFNSIDIGVKPKNSDSESVGHNITREEKKLEKLKKYEEEEEIRKLIKNDPTEKKKRTLIRLIIIAVTLLIIGGGIYSAKYKSNAEAAYNKAMNLYNSGKFEDAVAEFEKTDKYIYTGDKRNKLYWAVAMSNARSYNFHKAALYFKKNNGYSESDANYRSIINAYAGIVGAGKSHTVCLKNDGTVISVGDNAYGQCDVSKWNGISRVSAGGDHTVGVDRNRAVFATGDNTHGQCDVSKWKDIIDVSAGEYHTVGVENVGRVNAVGDNTYGQCDVDDWSGIIEVSAGSRHTVGLKLDGTVVAVGDNKCGECNVEGWKDIVLVVAGNGYTAGLKSDGSIVFTGDSLLGIDNAVSEKNVFSISAGHKNLIVVYEDGTVKVFGLSDKNQNATALWRNIVATCGGENHSVGIASDGKVYAVGANENGQVSVSEWTEIGIPKKTVLIRKGE